MMWLIIASLLLVGGYLCYRCYDKGISFLGDVYFDLAIFQFSIGFFLLFFILSSLVTARYFVYQDFKIKYDEINKLINSTKENNSNVLLGQVYDINTKLELKKLQNKRFLLFNDWFVDDRFEDLNVIEIPKHLRVEN